MTETLFEYDHILMRSEYRTPDPHAHLAAHLIIGLNTALHCSVEGKSLVTDAIFIASDKIHTAYSESGEMLVFLFDATSRYAERIERCYLSGNAFCALENQQVEAVRTLWHTNSDSLKAADFLILDYLELTQKNAAEIDDRVSETLKHIREMDEIPENAVSCLCNHVCLSKSRLSHLFKESLGISLSRYLAMEKMRKGYMHFQKYGNITEAAMHAGFDSPSHFAATCKRMFGISFSEFIRS
jgi:AraC-like DNA-binding protein